MIRLALFVRRGVFAGAEAVRGPKKKKGDVEVKAESTDIVNIFKERSDPQIKDIRQYPIYVQELSRGYANVHDLLIGIQNNTEIRMPGRANLKGYLKAFKRQRTKAFGQYKHLDKNPDIFSENDVVNRRAVFDLAASGRQILQQRQRQQELQAENQDDDDEE